MGRIVRVPLVVASASGYRGVRAYCTTARHASNRVMCTEIRITPSGTGTPVASSFNSYFPISSLTDGNLEYYPGTWSSDGGLPAWWGIVFSNSVPITAFEMYFYSYIDTYRPGPFDIQVSTDTTNGSDGTWATKLANQSHTIDVWNTYTLPK